jgi:uracil-DNA glycosylase
VNLTPHPATDALLASIRACTVCAEFLAAGPHPIVQFSATARIVIIGQAPGSKVHASGVPWNDDSGDRLRDWTGMSRDQFYDPARVALVPMGFCYPGKGKGGDLPPRPECAPLWHGRIIALLPAERLTLLVGTYAQKAYLGRLRGTTLTASVRDFRTHGADFFPLPHPAWRSVIWMRRNPWFEQDVLPALRSGVQALLGSI